MRCYLCHHRIINLTGCRVIMVMGPHKIRIPKNVCQHHTS